MPGGTEATVPQRNADRTHRTRRRVSTSEPLPRRRADGCVARCHVESVRLPGRTRHCRDGELQAGFAGLALAQYDGEDGIYLFYCDENWNCLNDTHHADIAAAEVQAEFEFEGVTFIEP